MLSLFPSLLVYQQVGPLLLRLTIGIIFIYWGYRKYKEPRNAKVIALSLLDIVIGLSFIIGLYMQLAALLACIILFVQLMIKIKYKNFLTDGVNYYFILFVISLSLLVTGPGILAFDLPL